MHFAHISVEGLRYLYERMFRSRNIKANKRKSMRNQVNKVKTKIDG